MHRYNSSKKVVKILAWIFGIIFLLILTINFNSQTTVRDLFIAALIFFVVFGTILFAVSRSFIEINEEQRTMRYCNWPIKTKVVPVDKIIRLGYPKQNYIFRSVGSFIYVLYDDPENPGKDKHIQIKDAQFDKKILAEWGKELKKINPKIEFESEFSQKILS